MKEQMKSSVKVTEIENQCLFDKVDKVNMVTLKSEAEKPYENYPIMLFPIEVKIRRRSTPTRHSIHIQCNTEIEADYVENVLKNLWQIAAIFATQEPILKDD